MANDDYGYDNLKNFHYLECIQKETTRLYGPSSVLFIRESAQDQYLKGIPIRKGTYLNVVTANHYNPKYFRDPLSFIPERWES